MPATAQRPETVSTDAIAAFRAANAKGRELTDRRGRLLQELHRLEHEYQERFRHVTVKGDRPVAAEAAELVGDDQSGSDEPRQAAESKHRLRQLRHDLEVAKKAVQMFFAPDGPWRRAQIQASREVCQQRAAEHRELAIAVARAAVRLLQASEAEQKFRDELNDQQLRVVDPIFPAVWKPVETLRESLFEHYLKDLDLRIPGIKQEILESEGVG